MISKHLEGKGGVFNRAGYMEELGIDRHRRKELAEIIVEGIKQLAPDAHTPKIEGNYAGEHRFITLLDTIVSTELCTVKEALAIAWETGVISGNKFFTSVEHE